jgi:hypothetical protein
MLKHMNTRHNMLELQQRYRCCSVAQLWPAALWQLCWFCLQDKRKCAPANQLASCGVALLRLLLPPSLLLFVVLLLPYLQASFMYAIRFARSSGFFSPANTILVPGMYLAAVTRRSRTAAGRVHLAYEQYFADIRAQDSQGGVKRSTCSQPLP